MASASPVLSVPPSVAGARLVPQPIHAIAGWSADAAHEAMAAFLQSCRAVMSEAPELRAARPAPRSLRRICAHALDRWQHAMPDQAEARQFFEAGFDAFLVVPESENGFLTAYFEPELNASLMPSARFPEPVLARPPDLVTLRAEDPRPAGLEPHLAAARQTADGLIPYPDRAAIWAGALAGRGLEQLWLEDKTSHFILQVQGSGRVTFPDGSKARLTYAGRNGHAYTSIGRILVESGEIPLGEMSLERLMGWLRSDPARGQALMERNRSFVFFAREPLADPERGPTGGAGVPLTPGRSLAVDRSIWPYGLPFWIAASPLQPGGGRVPLDRLMVAQDTGSAILGPARGDFFMGTGAEAGARAGLVRDAARFIVFWPKDGEP
jgi:membrane-bound lytic murein transglycosylase A